MNAAGGGKGWPGDPAGLAAALVALLALRALDLREMGGRTGEEEDGRKKERGKTGGRGKEEGG